MSASVTHLTRPAKINGKSASSLEVLFKILRDGKINGSSTTSGFICGETRAVCFQDAPIYSLAQNVYIEQQYRKATGANRHRYVGTGVMFPKPYVYNNGGRPVIYDDTDTAKGYLPEDQWWRIVRFDLADKTSFIDWTHEREWRMPGHFAFELKKATIILPNANAHQSFIEKCRHEKDIDVLGTVEAIVNLAAVFY